VRQAVPGTTLIEQDQAEAGRVEQAALIRRTAIARPVMQEDHRQAIDGAALLDMQGMPVAHRHLADIARRDRRKKVRVRHQASSNPLRIATRVSSAAFCTLSFCLM